MDSRLRRALETEAAVTTAKALAEIAPRLAALEERLAAIESCLPAAARHQADRPNPKGK